MSAAQLASLVDRLEKVTQRLETINLSKVAAASGSAAAPSADSGSAVSSPALDDYDALVAEYLAPFLASSETIGKEVKQAADILKAAFDAQRDFLAIAAQCKEPSQQEVQKLIQPISEQIQKLNDLNSKYRGEFNFHVSAVASGVPALGWVVIPKTPAPYVKEMLASSEFYSNKVLVNYKNKEPVHTEWVKQFKALLTELEKFVKKNHTTGVSWNPKGKDVSEISAAGAPAAPAAPKAPAAPAAPAASAAPAAKPAVNPANLFAEINKKGETGVTAGLKHVTKEMKTKNQPKQEPLQPAAAPKASSGVPSYAAGAAKKTGTPKFELEGNKWVVEYQEGNHAININDVEIKQTVYIYRCNNSVINVNGKVNNLTLDECSKVGLVFENAVASCEIVNCKSVEVQCKGKVPIVTIDKCTGVQLYLSKEGLDTEVVTSKSDAMNILIPQGEGEDLTELPVAEQFVTRFDKATGKLVTQPNSHV